MAYELTKKVTLTNLFTDPSFEGSNWVAYSKCTVSKDTTYVLNGSYSLKIVTSTSSESNIKSTANLPIVKGHKYYVCISKYQTSSTINNIQFYWPEAEPSMYDRDGTGHIKNSNAAANGWYKYSTVDTRSNWSSGNYLFRIDLENGGKAVTAYYDNAILIDLTADFGSGNEPDVEWCDENIPFFIGTKILDPYIPLYAKKNNVWVHGKTLYSKENGIWQKVENDLINNYININLKSENKYVWKKSLIEENTILLIEGGMKDLSSNNHQLTNTSVKLSTDQKKFKDSSLYFSGTSYIDVPLIAPLSSKWTVDWWGYQTDLGEYPVYFELYNSSTSTTRGYFIHAAAGGDANDRAWICFTSSQSAATTTSQADKVNKWTHYALTKNNTNLILYIDGVSSATLTISSPTLPDRLRIGAVNSNYSASAQFKGYIDSFRISDNVVRWSSNFTPPNEPYAQIEFLSDVDYNKYPEDEYINGYYYKRL